MNKLIRVLFAVAVTTSVIGYCGSMTSACADGDNIVWGTFAPAAIHQQSIAKDGDNIVWGTFVPTTVHRSF